jgi:hypothetical protein
MAKHDDQSVDLPAAAVSFGPSSHYACIGHSSISIIDALAYFVDTAEDAHRLGSQADVLVS